MSSAKAFIPQDQRQRLKTEEEKAREKAEKAKIVVSPDELRQQIIAEAGYTAEDFSEKPAWYIYAIGVGLIVSSAIVALKL